MYYQDIPLWENPSHTGKTQDDRMPHMAIYRVESQCNDRKRPLVLLCPGGGYGKISLRIGELLALKFCANGFHAAILHYSIHPQHYTHPIADLSKAVSMLRENSDQWGINPNKIAVFGESAGGHLAASLGSFWNTDRLFKTTGLPASAIKPNALLLAYPVITGGEFRHDDSFKELLGTDYSEAMLREMSLETQITPDMPPTFLWHTSEDELVPVENSLLLAGALHENHIPFAAHIFTEGLHGMALCDHETARNPYELNDITAEWLSLAVKWLNHRFNFQP
ncbi:MAG: hypothetical protein PWQ12_1761 [Clostridiales bacterium]|jgi:acetyl esterase/lipase|nr:hypothetical protein [Clostridiales bacterium]